LTALPIKSADKRALGRALTHPALEALAERLLPDFANLRVSVVGRDGITAVSVHTFGLSALDLIMEGSRPGALGRRAIASLAADGEDLEPTTEYRFGVDPQSRSDWEDFTEFCVSLAAHFGALRPLLPEDLGLATESGVSVDLIGAKRTLQLLRKHLGSLAQSSVRAAKQGQKRKLLDALLKLSLHALPEALPDAPTLFGAKEGAILAHAEAVEANIRKRIERARLASEESPESEAIIRALRILNGGELAAEVSLSKLKLPVGDERGFSLPKQSELMDWVAKYGHVRDDMRAFARALEAMHLIGDASMLPFELGQASTKVFADWLGTTLPEDGTSGGGSWFVVDGGGAKSLQTGGAVTGYIVDAWTERLPDKTTTVAAHFQFDAPSSKAPQSILLAVTPNSETQWTQTLLERTLLETVENAQLRAVTVPDVGRFGHHLPAIFVKDGINAGRQPPAEEDDQE